MWPATKRAKMRRAKTGSKATTMGEIDTLQMQEKAQDLGNQTNRKRASPDWWEEDEHGDCDYGDKKKQKTKHNTKPRACFHRRGLSGTTWTTL